MVNLLEIPGDVSNKENPPSPFFPRKVELRHDQLELYYEIKEQVGEGKFGIVKRVTHRSSKRDFAAKFITTDTQHRKDNAEHEIRVLGKLQHKRIIQLVDAFAPRDNERVLVMEIIEGGELFDRVIEEKFNLTEDVCRIFLWQICDAMAYVHAQNIIHMDLKPENILCLSNKNNRLKLIDFGLAKEVNASFYGKSMCGTAEFSAPEVVNFDPVNYKTDMWSVGVITYILLSGYSPFLGDEDHLTYNNVVSGQYDFSPPEFDHISEEAKDFVRKLLVYKSKDRMSAAESLKHPWLNKLKHVRKRKLGHKAQLRRYVNRRRWRKAFFAILALRRMGFNLEKLWRPCDVYSDAESTSSSSLRLPPLRSE